MGVNLDMQGKSYPPHLYEVGREKVREYARAVGDENPVYMDPAAAREAGFEGQVAPPMFAVVYQAGALGPTILDPQLGVNIAMLVHGEQEYDWHRPVVAGDEISTGVTVDSIEDKGKMDVVTLRAESKNQHGDPVATGITTLIVRKG